MKTLAFGVVLAALLAACGGGDAKPKDAAMTTDSGPTGCSPLTQMGCQANEKCTWVIDQTDPAYIGHIGCVPATGSAAVGADCTFGSAGQAGYDNCIKGAVCSEFKHPGTTGQCKLVCDQEGGQPKCDAASACVVYPPLFSTGSASPSAAGVCSLKCDPMLDNDFDGSGILTKRTMTCGSNALVGCYGMPSMGVPPATAWTCEKDVHGSPDLNLRHRAECTTANGCAEPQTGVYVNSCNQGYEPVLQEATGNTTVICVAICRPADCYDGSAGTCGGIGNPNRHGVYPDMCDGVRRSGTFDTGSGREECAYSWGWEISTTGWLPSDTSDTVGFCKNHYLYKYDPTGGNNPTMPLPGCEFVKLHGTHNPADLANPNVYYGAVDPELACVNSGLAFGSGSGLVRPADMPAVDAPRFLYHRVMAGEPPRTP